jgi:hypothetical protein
MRFRPTLDRLLIWFETRLPTGREPAPARAQHLLQRLQHEQGDANASAQARIWQRVQRTIDTPQATLGLEALRESLAPPLGLAQSLWPSIQVRLAEAPERWQPRVMKWTVALAAFTLLVRVSPLVFLAPETVASSSVTLTSTVAGVSIDSGELLRPIEGQITLLEPTTIVTDTQGQATLVLHSYGVVRLAPETSVRLLRVTNGAIETPSLVLERGTVWVQGLSMASIGSLTIATREGDVRLHEGSVSVTQSDDRVELEVWDRSVTIGGDTPQSVHGGQRVTLYADRLTNVESLPTLPTHSWAFDNLSRDAVHRHEIAQWQRELRAASAGILPTSPLYRVKRAAEAVDLFLTFDEESRVRKQLSLAETRLNEAAALLPEARDTDEVTAPTETLIAIANPEPSLMMARTDTAVAMADPFVEAPADETTPLIEQLLDEYQRTILDLAAATPAPAPTSDGSTNPDNLRALVQQQALETAAELSAALPSDQAYRLKEVTLETTVALTGSADEVASATQEAKLLDALAALKGNLHADPTRDVRTLAPELRTSLEALRSEAATHSPEVRREALALSNTLSSLELQQRPEPTTPTTVTPTPRPTPNPLVATRSLTASEIDSFVSDVLTRVRTYQLPRSRRNQLEQEFRLLAGHPDEARILRRLQRELADPGLTAVVRTKLQEVRTDLSSSSQSSAATASGETEN